MKFFKQNFNSDMITKIETTLKLIPAIKTEELKWKCCKWSLFTTFDPNRAKMLLWDSQIWNFLKQDYISILILKIEFILITIIWYQNWKTEPEILEMTTFFIFRPRSGPNSDQKFPYKEHLQKNLFVTWKGRQEPYLFPLYVCKADEQKWKCRK